MQPSTYIRLYVHASATLLIVTCEQSKVPTVCFTDIPLGKYDCLFGYFNLFKGGEFSLLIFPKLLCVSHDSGEKTSFGCLGTPRGRFYPHLLTYLHVKTRLLCLRSKRQQEERIRKIRPERRVNLSKSTRPNCFSDNFRTPRSAFFVSTKLEYRRF